MLETIRIYGREHLSDPAAWREVCHAHCRHYMAVAEAAETELVTADQLHWLDRLEQEHDNLRAALTWATGERGEPEMALRIASALMRFWYSRGYLDEGRAWLETVLRLADAQPIALRLKAMQGLGNLCYAKEDNGAARVHFAACLTLAQSIQDRRAQASALASLANVEVEEGNYASARQRFEASLTLFQELEDVRGMALTLSNLATLACGEGDYAAARALHERGLALFRQLGALHNIAHEANNMVHTLLNLREIDGVLPYLEEGLTLSEKLDSPLLLAHCLANYRALAVMTGHLQRAAVLLGAESALREKLDFPLPPVAVAAYRQDEAAMRAGLAEVEYERCQARGCDMTEAEVRAYARQQSG
jgi:tetratricopeptide (TPR) repeat protein